MWIDGEYLGHTGVVGLSTAIRIQEHGGYHVTVIGETIPGDPKSIRYTSPWAVRFIFLIVARKCLILSTRGLTI